MKRLALTLFMILVPITHASAQSSRVRAQAVDSEGSVGYGQATVVVPVPAERVREAILDYGAYAEFMPHFTQSRVLSSRGSSALVYMQASAFHDTITLWANMRIRELRPRGDTEIVEARMTDGNLEEFTARWEMTPLDDGATRIRFRLLIEPDLPFPSGVITDENVRNARRVVTALRARLVRG
jgi:ribosome-associated toxin RatA of RatAB toxin-antitoxin module